MSLAFVVWELMDDQTITACELLSDVFDRCFLFTSVIDQDYLIRKGVILIECGANTVFKILNTFVITWDDNRN
jgi:hypothetical protein